MAQDARNGVGNRVRFEASGREERDPEDFGRGKPEAKRLNSDRIWTLEEDFFRDMVDKHAGELVKGAEDGTITALLAVSSESVRR